MEIAIKGVLGAFVAIAIHYAIMGKYSFLSGLIVAAPIFALFAHVALASAGRALDLQGSVHFHLLSMVPTAIYLVMVWWLATRTNIWFALIVAALCWAISASTLVAVWIKGSYFVVNFLYVRLAGLILASSLAGTIWLIVNKYRKNKRVTTAALFSLALVVTGSAYHFAALNPGQSLQLMPGDKRACVLLQTTLALGSNGKEAGQIQHSVVAHYLSLAKHSRSTGDAHHATVYSSRARDVLIGSWVHADQRRPKFC